VAIKNQLHIIKLHQGIAPETTHREGIEAPLGISDVGTFVKLHPEREMQFRAV
jgi:hypothetical protein